MDVTPFFRVYLVAKIQVKNNEKKTTLVKFKSYSPCKLMVARLLPLWYSNLLFRGYEKNFWGVRVHSSTKIVLFIGGGQHPHVL